jgi:signal transduction histidine kinase
MDDVGAPPGVVISSGERVAIGRPDRAQMARYAVLAGLGAAALAVAMTLSSDHVRDRWGDALYLADNIAGLSVAGACWLVRRPASALGSILLASAAAWVLVSFQSADAPPVFSLAVFADGLLAVVTVYVFLAFPTGRLRSGLGKAAMALLLLVLAFGFLPHLLLSPHVAGAHALAGCRGPCPANALQVGTVSQGALDALGRVEALGVVLVAGLVSVELLRAFRTGTPARRRALCWIVLVGAPYVILVALRQLTVFVVDAPADVVEAVRWALVGVRMLVPWAFVAALLHAEVFAGAALEDLVARLERRPDARGWQHDVAGALDDPSLRIALWAAPEHAYIGVDGSRARRDGPGRGWFEIDDHDGHPVAVIVHDPVLEDDPELLEAAGTATLISLESGRLADEIRDARVRLLAVAEEERRRLEHDLQEGAEQRLLALRVKLGLMGAMGDAGDERLLAEIAEDLDATMDDLRRLAHGIYPALLRQEGLGAAVRAAARRSPIPVTVRASGLGRYPADVESVVYFCCLEAMRNAATHAGPGAAATIRIDAPKGCIGFVVTDSGAGLAPGSVDGGGLAAMRERLRAVDGSVAIESSPGHGTTVRGEIPLPAPEPRPPVGREIPARPTGVVTGYPADGPEMR